MAEMFGDKCVLGPMKQGFASQQLQVTNRVRKREKKGFSDVK